MAILSSKAPHGSRCLWTATNEEQGKEHQWCEDRTEGPCCCKDLDTKTNTAVTVAHHCSAAWLNPPLWGPGGSCPSFNAKEKSRSHQPYVSVTNVSYTGTTNIQ